MLRRAKGELIVSYQDFIKIKDDGLERFWKAYQENKDTFFTAPVGKTNKTDFTGNPKWDWRKHPESRMDWTMWEIDWGCAPLSALKQIGGFDEELDKFWSFDNVNVGCRADLAGFKFGCIKDNEAVAYDHDAFIQHPFRAKYNPSFHNERLELFRHGYKLSYI